MPLFSAFTPFGHLRYKRGPSRFQVIYQSMRDGQGDAYGPNDTHQEARIYAAARCIAVSDGEIERAKNEAHPLTAQQTLAEQEKDFGLSPRPSDTCAQRQAALAVERKLLRGSRKEALDEALSVLLGSDFVEAVPMKDLEDPPVQWPSSPADVGNFKRGALYRAYTCTEPGALIGARNLHFVDIVPGQEPLKTGDIIVIDTANLGLTEAVTVSAVISAPSTDADGYVTNYVTVTLAKPHDAGVVCTTSPCPLLISSQRYILIRVTAAAAFDPVKRRAIDAKMRRILRGVTRWEIQVADMGGGNQLTLDDPVLGRLGGYVLG